ncbi:MAG TPA: ZIP family metal transporter [Thermoplasmata archaeon]
MAGPSELEVIGLGAFAGFTIFLGMIFVRIGGLSSRTRAGLSAVAAGILLFIFYDVVANGNEIVTASLDRGNDAQFAEYAGILVVGISVGVLGLLAFEDWFMRRVHAQADQPDASSRPTSLDPKALATMIAIGIGFHNFSEGLAIGASFAVGALSLGTVLVIGFALHNSTEGFGILGPALNSGSRFSTMRLLALGLVGGGPTLLGTIVGTVVTSDPLSILFFGLAAGAILYVVLQITRPLLVAGTRDIATVGLLVGFLLGYATDLVVRFGGA